MVPGCVVGGFAGCVQCEGDRLGIRAGAGAFERCRGLLPGGVAAEQAGVGQRCGGPQSCVHGGSERAVGQHSLNAGQ